MIKGQSAIVAAVLVLALTAAGFLLVTQDAGKQAERSTKHRVESGFHAVRQVLELDAQAAKAHAGRLATQASPLFGKLADFRADLGREVDKAVAALGPEWKPDVAAVLDRSNVVLWSRLTARVAAPRADREALTNRRMREGFIDAVKTRRQPVATGMLKVADALARPQKVVVVPVLGAGDVPVLVLVLGWQGKVQDAVLKEKGLACRDKISDKSLLRLLQAKRAVDDDFMAVLSQRFPKELQSKFGLKGTFVGLLGPRGVLMRRSDRAKLFVGQALAPGSSTIHEARGQRHATTDVWLQSRLSGARGVAASSGDGRPEILRVGFGPVVDRNRAVVGIVVLAWSLGDVHSTRMARLAGAEVAYLHNRSVSSTTLRKAKSSALAEVPQTKLAPDEWKAPGIKALKVDGARYLAAAGPFPRAGDGAFSFVLLASVDKAREPFGFARWFIVLFGAMMLVGFIVVGWLVRRSFILPIDEIEKGVADIVAGNMEYTFGVPSAETEGLAYELNVMMAQILGRPEPGEDGAEDTDDGGPRIAFSLGALPDHAYGPEDSQLLPRLDEERDVYFKRLFKEYLAAMDALGEDTGGMTIQSFRRKLEVNESTICSRMKCSEVRFMVQRSEEEVVMRPFPIA